jgi:drug/metabolite transporter (DMT)-like permease
MSGLLLALGCALAWALLDALRKQVAASVPAVASVVWLSALQAPIFLAWAGLDGATLEIDPLAYAPWGLACVSLNAAASLAFVRALQLSPLGVTIPFLSLTPAFAALFAWASLGELPRPLQLVGIGGVMLGAGALAWGEAGTRLERGSVLMIGVALAWSLTGSLDKLALARASTAVHAAVQALAIPALLAGWLVARGRAGELARARDVKGALAAAVLLGALATALQYAAIQLTLVALVDALKRAVGALAAVAIGRWWFDERLSGRRLAAVAGLTLSTLLVLLGGG